ncbi:hypothetical protein ACFLR1_06015 [Bacteroidota bacterium]
MLLNYLGHAISSFNAWRFEYDPFFSYEGMENIQDTTGWTKGRIGAVYLAPPLTGLFFSVVALALFYLSDNKKTHLRTFLFWMSLNGFMLYYSYIITGILSAGSGTSQFYTGFVGYHAWLYWDTKTSMLALALQALVSLPFALLFARPILELNFSGAILPKSKGKLNIFLNAAGIPFLMGCVLVLLLTFPMDMAYQSVRMVSYLPVFLLCVTAMTFWKSKSFAYLKAGLSLPPQWVLLTTVAALVFLGRFVLSVKVERFF